MQATAPLLSEPARRLAAAACRGWIGAGLLLLAFAPAMRGSVDLLGWMPFWLFVAPLLVLAQVEALGGFRASTAWVSRSRRALRRRAWRGGQARRVRPARAALRG